MSAAGRPYAEAFLASAPSGYDVAGFLEKASAVKRALLRDERLRAFFRAPALPAEAKRKALEDLSGRAGLDDFGQRFLRVVLDNRRIGDLAEILSALSAAHDKKRSIVAARVTVASPIGEAEKAKIGAALSREVGKAVRVAVEVDPRILAGFVARVESEVFDASAARAIERFGENAKEERSQGRGDRKVPGER
jgi:F-type H+-transporting ATPase subunit delta